MADTRKEKRAPVSLKVRFKSATVDEFIEHYSRDVSTGGIFIKSSRPLSIGTLLKFQFQLKDESALIRGVGRVVWVRATDAAAADEPAGMGIKFIKVDDESRAIIARVVEAHEGQKGEYEAGRESATEAERPSTPVTDDGGSSPNQFFPTLPDAELPLPEDRTAVRQAAEFLAAALSEGATDQAAARAAEANADQARARTAQIEAQRRSTELEAAQRFARPAQVPESLPSMIVDDSVSQPSAPSLAGASRGPSSSRPPIAMADSAVRGSWPAAPASASAQETWPSPAPGDTQPVTDPGDSPAAYVAQGRRGSDPAFGALRTAAEEVPDTSDLGRPSQRSPKPRSPLVPFLVLVVVVVVAAFVAMRGRPSDDLTGEPESGAVAAVAPLPGTAEPVPGTPEPAVQEPTVTPQADETAGDAALAGDTAAEAGMAADSPADAATALAVPQPMPAVDPVPTGSVTAGGDASAEAVDTTMVQVQLRSSPRSSKFIMNGQALPGREPLLKMKIGESVHFRVTSPGRFPEERDVVPDAQTKVVRFMLPALPFLLRVITDPPGARIAAGTKRGDSPADINMADSVHGPLLVQARLPGYQLAKVTVPVNAFVEHNEAMVAELTIKLVARPEGSPPEGEEEALEGTAPEAPSEPAPSAPAVPAAP